ncbi:unnamed protein product [Medioppia subpectinata]|uniref:Nuclear receptor domain-containing protein n=1 Tax=Medioppia subpectinata TaxID=1979941 RepID=A0A7R9KGD9_9ACAR|nr:unnamed protein product [Medioppia subpectinata]CAG2101857.1 unnamed protein product [Medioppia subpectinata]
MLESNETMNRKLCDKNLHKICEVCGDKERGRNFGVITCESCKAFFRRFGLRDKLINICPSNGNCIINPLTRRICQKCRLQKCFAVGMRKEFIRTDEQNEERKEIIRENKLKREKCNDLTDSSVSSVYSFTDSSNDLIIFNDNKEKDILNELLDNTIDFTLDEISDVGNSITDTIIDETFVVIMDINEKCENTAIVPMFREITDYNGLNELENNRISGLSSAAVLFEHKMSDNIIQDDANTIMLTAIMFYNPNRPNITHKQTVKLEQQLYIYLLQRYLLWKHRSDSESRVKLQKLMLSLKVLNTLNELEIKFGVPNYKNIQQYMGPLVKEIYDL